MNQENLNLLKEAKKELQKIVEGFEILHTKNEGSPSVFDRKDTKFAKWYYNEGNVFNKFSSFLLLEKYYNDLFNNYDYYIEKEKSPIQKSFFSNGTTKHKSKLDDLFQKLMTSGSKLFSAIDMFTENVERSKIIKRATGKKEIQNTAPKKIEIESGDIIEDKNIDLPRENNISESKNLDSKETTEVIENKGSSEETKITETENKSGENSTEVEPKEIDEFEELKKMMKEDFENKIKSLDLEKYQ